MVPLYSVQLLSHLPLRVLLPFDLWMDDLHWSYYLRSTHSLLLPLKHVAFHHL